MPVSGQGSGHFIRSPVLGRLRLAVEAQADTGGYRRIQADTGGYAVSVLLPSPRPAGWDLQPGAAGRAVPRRESGPCRVWARLPGTSRPEWTDARRLGHRRSLRWPWPETLTRASRPSPAEAKGVRVCERKRLCGAGNSRFSTALAFVRANAWVPAPHSPAATGGDGCRFLNLVTPRRGLYRAGCASRGPGDSGWAKAGSASPSRGLACGDLPSPGSNEGPWRTQPCPPPSLRDQIP